MPIELVDGFGAVPFGVNNADDPEDLREGHLYKLINGTVRSGRVETRPPFVDRELTFEDEYSETLFKTGRFQGCKSYEVTGRIVAMVGGACFLINPDTLEALCLVPIVGLMSSNVDRCYFLDAGRFFIIQDGFNLPIIMDHGVARRSDPDRPYPFSADFDDDGSPLDKGEVPIGTHMATAHGRIAVALTGSPDFVIGNIALPSFPESILFFTETDYLSGGGAFRIPANFGNITAMGVQANPDTAEGDGPLIVSGSRGISWYDITQNREDWPDIDISKTATVYAGASSGDAFVNVNSDIVFYGRNEIRTMAYSRDKETRGVVERSFSREVAGWLDHNDPQLDHMVSAVVHDDRYYCTVAPEIVELPDSSGEADVQFKGLVVLDFKRSNYLDENGRPAFDGLWTGINFTGLCSFSESKRGFAFYKGLDGMNGLSEIGPAGSSFDNNRAAQVMVVQPKRFTFKLEGGQRSSGLSAKMFGASSLWASRVLGDTRITSYVKADDRAEWAEGGTVSINAKACIKAYSDDPMVNLRPQSRSRITIAGPSSTECDSETGHLKAHGFGFDTCLHVEGVARIRAVLHTALADLDRPPEVSSCSLEAERTVSTPVRDDYEYKIEKARVL